MSAVNTSDDGSCIFLGCTDSTALNFIAYANTTVLVCLKSVRRKRLSI